MTTSTTNSESEWVWQPEHALYYNFRTQVWAKPGADGAWVYSNEQQQQAASTSAATLDSDALSYDNPVQQPSRKYFDQDAPDAEEPLNYDDDAPPLKRRRPSRTPSPQPALAREPRFQIPLLRLVVRSSDTIPAHQTIVTVSATEPLVVGRDRSFDKRLRLKALACSKTHASVFWMAGAESEEEGYWAVSDFGSTQGTWLGREGEKESRLSEAKVASEGVRLAHDDTLRIGETTFSIHIHPSLACDTCALSPDGSNLLPLAEAIATTSTPTPAGLSAPTLTKSERGSAARQNLRDLKQQFLKPKNATASAQQAAAQIVAADSASVPPPTKFVDRAAARRARHGPEIAPPLQAKPTTGAGQSSSPFFNLPGANAASVSSATSSSAATHDPFDRTSRGALLLEKLTKVDGSAAIDDVALGKNNPSPATTAGGLGKLIEARGVAGGGKAGLGSRQLEVVGHQTTNAGAGDWRDRGRESNRKRFEQMSSIG